jgi:hypothetical protein
MLPSGDKGNCSAYDEVPVRGAVMQVPGVP